jgi:hypothetical protein
MFVLGVRSLSLKVRYTLRLLGRIGGRIRIIL